MEINWLYAIIPLFLLIALMKFSGNGKRKLPPSPWPEFPVLGHVHLLRFPLHRTYDKLSQKLGPIFSVRLGNRLIVVVSSQAMVEECFTKNDVVLASRPKLMLGKYIGYKHTILSSSPYGDYWRYLRRLTTIEIFSSARLNSFQVIREDEIRVLLQKLYRKSYQDFTRVELGTLISDLTFNGVMRMMAGKRYFGIGDEDNEEAKKFRGLRDEVFTLAGVSHPSDFFPVLKWIDYGGYEKNLAKITDQMDAFMQGLVDEHCRNKGTDTVLDRLISLQESEPENYTDVTIKGIIMVMLLAGTGTSAVTIEWAMSVLLNHPDKLVKARAEIDNLLGNDRLVNESDLSKLPYLQNIISETYRLFPAAPLLIPHEASGDCKVGGYDIPRGAILIVNAWTIHRDPTVWDDPTSFKPERFDAGEVGPPKLLPFGMGRRSCPGAGLAHRVVGLALGSLIQCFEWQRVDEALVDLTEEKGLVMPKLVRLEARCKARDVLGKVFLRLI